MDQRSAQRIRLCRAKRNGTSECQVEHSGSSERSGPVTEDFYERQRALLVETETQCRQELRPSLRHGYVGELAGVGFVIDWD